MPGTDPQRILVAGDWHGDTPRMRAAIHAAQVHGCDAVLHAGDLGILWPRTSPKTFDLPLVEELKKAGVGFYFVDGNHDNHAALRGDYEPDESGFFEVLRGVWWAPRAHRWTWSGTRFAALGGAYSVDRASRTEGDSIWKGLEEVQPADVDALGHHPVDVLVTHEVPHGVPVKSSIVLDAWLERDASMSRHLLRRAADLVRPRLVLSGHWHQRLSHVLPDDVRCEVLDMNGRVGNAVILELPSLDLTEMADLDPAWHRWTRRAEKNFQHKKANQRFHLLVEQLRAEGLSETDARKNASSILQDQGTD